MEASVKISNLRRELVNEYSLSEEEQQVFIDLQKEVSDKENEVQKLRQIIKDGGLANECVSGWGEVKFCSIRNGDRDGCLRCFF